MIIKTPKPERQLNSCNGSKILESIDQNMRKKTHFDDISYIVFNRRKSVYFMLETYILLYFAGWTASGKISSRNCCRYSQYLQISWTIYMYINQYIITLIQHNYRHKWMARHSFMIKEHGFFILQIEYHVVLFLYVSFILVY